jgi:hypothetical protein
VGGVDICGVVALAGRGCFVGVASPILETLLLLVPVM